MTTHRKSVSYLATLKRDVAELCQDVQHTGETLEGFTFELHNLLVENIRTDEDGRYTALRADIKSTREKLVQYETELDEAVNKLREFF